jgi:hypothetical protein
LFDTHQRYEELCALAATGQLPEGDILAFRAHVAECSKCSALVEEFTQTSACVAAHAAGQWSEQVPDEMTQRFVARARTQGITMSPGIAGRPTKALLGRWVPAGVVVAAAAALAITVAVVITTKAPFRRLSASTTIPARDVGRVEVPVSTPVPRQDDAPRLRAQVKALIAQLRTNREAIAASQGDNQVLQTHIEALDQEKQGLQAKARDQSATISKLQADIDQMNSEKAANDVAILAEENELRELRQMLARKEVVLEQQRHLLAAGDRARELVVARNLHIVDVYEADGEGNEERSFGRIFYTEGKSLVFYAYDLTSPGSVDKRVVFYAWGERLGGPEPVKRLGIFRNDDVKDGRWILTFDDPRVLAQINSVFVTGEHDGRPVAKPTGKRMLFGFLGNKPNHP